MKKRLLGIFITFVMVLSLATTAAFADGEGSGDSSSNASTNKTVMLGTSEINAYEKSTGKVDTIYYGTYTYDGKSYNVPWYVIGLNTSNKTSFMFSKYMLGFSQFRTDFGYYGTNNLGTVSDSKLKTKTEGLYDDIFTSGEQEKINQTDITCSVDDPSSATHEVTGAYLFPLSSSEASDLNSDILKARNIVDPDGDAKWWWLRSSSNDLTASGANDAGGIYINHVFNSGGVRPAFNLNLDSVLFTSLISTTDKGSEYKLTLLDDNMTIAKTENEDAARRSSTLIIPYTISGTNSANASQVSVLILDKEYTDGNTNNANVLAYGKLNTESFSTTGSGTFMLPDTLTGKTLGTDYHVYILAEDVNGTYETDYASAPVEISSVKEIAETPDVKPVPDDPEPAPVDDVDETTPAEETSVLPKTGDNSSAATCVALVLMGCAATIAMFAYKKKKHSK